MSNYRLIYRNTKGELIEEPLPNSNLAQAKALAQWVYDVRSGVIEIWMGTMLVHTIGSEE